MSFLSALGGDIKKVFGWLGSPTGQAIVATGEGIVETVFPAATGIINLINKWATEAIKVEGIAVAAGSGDGSGTQKAAIVLNSLTPEVLDFAKANGLPAPTAATIASINTDIVSILNKLTGQVSPAT